MTSLQKDVTQSGWPERLRAVRLKLRWGQDEMGQHIGRGREWVSRLENGRGEFSDYVRLKIEELERVPSQHIVVIPPDLIKGDPRAILLEEPSTKYKTVASRLPQQRTPSTRADCETYMQQLFDAAESSDNPNAWPVIHDRLKKKFPLEEWDEKDT